MQLSVRTVSGGLGATPARRPRPASVVRFRKEGPKTGSEHHAVHEGLPMSLFVPFKHLPADGTTVPIDEEMCDPEETVCKTPRHVYEVKCRYCSGTGFARASSHGRRGHLANCLLCHGMGYVRITTSRFEPAVDEEHPTMARPERWQGPGRAFQTMQSAFLRRKTEEEKKNRKS